jgi:hypothetical protein
MRISHRAAELPVIDPALPTAKAVRHQAGNSLSDERSPYWLVWQNCCLPGRSEPRSPGKEEAKKEGLRGEGFAVFIKEPLGTALISPDGTRKERLQKAPRHPAGGFSFFDPLAPTAGEDFGGVTTKL